MNEWMEWIFLVEELSFTNFNYIFLLFSFSFHNKMSDDGSNQSIDSRENSNFSPPLKIKTEPNQHRFQSSAMNLVSSSKFVAQLPFHLIMLNVRHRQLKREEREGREV